MSRIPGASPGRARVLGWVIALALAVLAFAPGAARADFQFNLDTGNSAISGYSGPYASVDVNLTSSTTAAVTFTSLSNGTDTYLMGDGGTVGLNVNGTFSVGTITLTSAGASAGFSSPSVVSAMPGSEDGFGNFNLSVTTFDGYAHAVSAVSVNLSLDSGTWASAADVLTANSRGAVAAAHIFVAQDPLNENNPALVTGYAAGNGGSGPPPVAAPVPSSMVLALSGLISLGLLNVRRLRRTLVVAA